MSPAWCVPSLTIKYSLSWKCPLHMCVPACFCAHRGLDLKLWKNMPLYTFFAISGGPLQTYALHYGIVFHHRSSMSVSCQAVNLHTLLLRFVNDSKRKTNKTRVIRNRGVIYYVLYKVNSGKPETNTGSRMSRN